MLKLRVRLVNDDGTVGEDSRVLDTTLIEYGTTLNGSATLSFNVSRDSYIPVEYPFVVRVEYSWNEGSYNVVPHHSHFIIEKDSDDSKDPARLGKYEGVEFVTWLLEGALIPWSTAHKDYKRTWLEPGRNDASPGWILHGLLNENKVGGWFPMLTWNFNGSTDSNGTTWSNDVKVNLPWEFTKNAGEVLTHLVDDTLCDWTSAGTQLRLYHPGEFTRDMAEVVLGGPAFDSVPVKVDASNQYSHVRAAPETLPWQNHTSNPRIRQRFGHRSIMVSQSGVKDVATSNKLIQPYIDEGKVSQREESYIWTPAVLSGGSNTSSEVAPFKDFYLGDAVTVLSRGGKVVRRVIGIVLTSTSDGAEVRTVVGDKVLKAGTKLRKKLTSGLTGGSVSGTGASFPASPGPSPLKPSAPLGLVVVSNTAGWIDLGTPQSIIELSWSPVTSADDGSESTVVEYEVWSRRPDEELSRDTASIGTTATINNWTPGEVRHIAVRAKADNGMWGDFSNEVIVTPLYPPTIVPKAPLQPTEVSNVGAFTNAGPVATVTISWPAVTETVDDEPVTISEYQVWQDDITLFNVNGTSATFTIPSGIEREYKVRALSNIGAWSDPSPGLLVTGASPGLVTRNPSDPILTTGYGNAFARWDGTYTGGGTNGAHSVWTEAAMSSGGPWLRQGMAMTGPGTTLLSLGAVGEEVFVRFVAVDQLERVTGTSGVESIVIAAIDGEAIMVDSIEGNRLKFGTVETDHLSPNVGETLNITANESVQIIVGQQEQLSTDVAAAQGAADNAQETALDAQQVAAQASADAAIADAKALVAVASADQANANIEAQQSVFVVTETGADVRSIDSTNIVRITPGSVAIIQNGTPASTWDGLQFISNQIVTNRVELGQNHAIERSGSRTIIQQL